MFKFGIQGATFTDLSKSEANMTLGCLKTNSKSDGKNKWVDGWNPDGDFLCFIDTGSKFSKAYYYVPQWKIDEDGEWDGYDAGWYLDGDEDYICQNELVTINPGDGVAIKAYSQLEGKEPVVSFPSALAK